jgi:5'-deoxy-5'-methylthioadenosine phosphorylase
MSLTAIIGGSGFDTFEELAVSDAIFQDTPYGQHSGPILQGHVNNNPCIFLPRHGVGHHYPPHTVNYRANIWMLKQLGVSQIIAFNVVGGINSTMSPDTIVIPEQIIDYTSNREHTFFDGDADKLLEQGLPPIDHIDFTYPYALELRKKLIRFFYEHNIDFVGHGVYGCTQGPRLESAAEVERYKRDGCDMVGMTGMPETALAKELGIDYVSVAIVVNWAAGVSNEMLSMIEIMNTVKKNMKSIKTQLPNLLKFL